jgi:hypothetical protein
MKESTKINTPTLIVIALVIATASFFGGMKYQQSRPRIAAGNFQQGQRNGGVNFPGGTTGTRNMNNRPVSGEILSSDDKSITVKQSDGSSKIVLITSTTTFNKAAEATKTDLKTGEKVSIFGVTNADGSVTAQNIQLNPMMRGLGASPSAAPSK